MYKVIFAVLEVVCILDKIVGPGPYEKEHKSMTVDERLAEARARNAASAANLKKDKSKLNEKSEGC